MEKINALLEKYDRFRYARIRAIYTPSDTSAVITLAVEDDDGEPVAKVAVECTDITQKRLLVGEVLPFLDMMSGVSILEERNLYAFAIGHCDTMLPVLNAPLFVVCRGIGISEELL